MKRIMKKKIMSILTACMVMGLTTSCDSFFEKDNFAGPNVTMQGAIFDKEGNALQVENGDGARIKLLDYGYSENPQEIYLKVKGDGTFINTKMFNSTYDIIAEGPFVPLIQRGHDSEVIVDNSMHDVTAEKFNDLIFEVEPYLKLEWVGKPVINNDGTVTVQFKLERGTTNEAFHKPIKEVFFAINSVKYVGNGANNEFCSVRVTGEQAENMLGKVNTMTTKYNERVPLESGRSYYLRVGARMDYTADWGASKFNYTSTRKIVMP